jgi:hypothetical protein
VEETVEAVVAAAQARGWTAPQARRRLSELGWDTLLPALGDTLQAEVVADDLRRHTRCQICGHPLHQVVGDIAVPVDGHTVLVRHLPYTAACSCGYAMPLIPAVWTALARLHVAQGGPGGPIDAAALRGAP